MSRLFNTLVCLASFTAYVHAQSNENGNAAKKPCGEYDTFNREQQMLVGMEIKGEIVGLINGYYTAMRDFSLGNEKTIQSAKQWLTKAVEFVSDDTGFVATGYLRSHCQGNPKETIDDAVISVSIERFFKAKNAAWAQLPEK